MKSIFFAFVLMTSALANATWCRGEVKINQWNYDLSIAIDAKTGLLEVMDISNDLEEWVPFRVSSVQAKPGYFIVQTIWDGEHHDVNLPPDGYYLQFEVESLFGLPSKLTNLQGKLGYTEIGPTNLQCELDEHGN